MIRVGGLRMPLSYTEDELKAAVAAKLKTSVKDILTCSLFKRSVDARRKDRRGDELNYEVGCLVEEDDGKENGENCA